MSTKNQPDVVVIGGGLGGLATAALLGRHGKRPIVIEKATRLGGRARSQETQGFTFNLGPHALYRGGPAHRLLATLDVAATGRPPVEGGSFAAVEGRLGVLPTGFASLLRASWLTLAERLELGGLLARIGRLDPRGLSRVSAEAWIVDHVTRPRVRDTVRAFFHVATYTAALEILSAETAIRQIQGALRGVLYLDGGWQTLVDGLEACAISHGTEIRRGARAARVVVDDGRVRGVELDDGSAIPALSVVLATDPSSAATMLTEDPVVARAAAEARPAIAACLDVGLASPGDPTRAFLLGIDAPYYVSVHSLAAKLTPRGSVVHVAKYLRPDERASEDELWDVLERLLPGARRNAATHRYLPSLTVSSTVPEARSGGFAGRPPARSTTVEGTYFVGDWVGPEGLLADAVAASASAVAAMIAGVRAELAA